mgnify:CR=1 FL=1
MKFNSAIAKNKSSNVINKKSLLRVKLTIRGDFHISLPLVYEIKKHQINGRVIETKLFIISLVMVAFTFFVFYSIHESILGSTLFSLICGLIIFFMMRHQVSKAIRIFLKMKKQTLR